MSMMLRRAALALVGLAKKILHTVTSATGLVTFSTQLADPLESCVCEFSPVQSGTGDPSPSNIRLISGFTGVTVKNAVSINRFIPNDGNTRWSQDGVIVDYVGGGKFHVHGQATSTSGVSPKIPFPSFVIPSGAGRLMQINNSSAVSYTLRLFNGTSQIDTWGLTTANRETSAYSSMQGKTIDRFDFRFNTTATVDFYIMPEFIRSLDQTVSVNWTSEAGTVYGGTIDVVSGVLSVTWVSNVFDGSEDESWWVSSNIRYLTNALNANYVRTSAAYIKGDKTKSVAAGSLGASSENVCFVHGANSMGIAKASINNNTTAFRAWLSENPQQLVYKLKTPTTYQLTPEQISSLIGSNTVWHDANGAITVGYYDMQ